MKTTLHGVNYQAQPEKNYWQKAWTPETWQAVTIILKAPIEVKVWRTVYDGAEKILRLEMAKTSANREQLEAKLAELKQIESDRDDKGLGIYHQPCSCLR